MTKQRQHVSARTRSIGITPAERAAVAISHGLFEIRAYLRVRCAHDPQAQRLSRVAEHAADLLCPRDPVGTYGDGDSQG